MLTSEDCGVVRRGVEVVSTKMEHTALGLSLICNVAVPEHYRMNKLGVFPSPIHSGSHSAGLPFFKLISTSSQVESYLTYGWVPLPLILLKDATTTTSSYFPLSFSR